MQVVCIILQTIMTVITVWMMVTFAFQLYVSIWGFKKRTRDYDEHAPKTRFLALVPAHNEGAVIADIIDNLRRMDYPKELYDFYILADNCDDHTADIARAMGAKVLEFHNARPDEPTGKSVVLQKAFEALPGYQDRYDMVMFFDADNLIDLNMFREVNSQYLSGKNVEIIQCYLGCKNKKGLVALFYYLTYTIANRFLQYGRLRLGLNCGIGGTGFAVTTSYLYKRGGWTAVSLTEDTELQFAATLDGRKILWNHHARVYDEKPTSWRVSYRQRVRWAQGHWFVAFKNLGKLFEAGFRRRIPAGEFVSTLVQMLFPTTYVGMLANTVILLFFGVATVARWVPATYFYKDWHAFLMSNIPGVVFFVYSMIVQFGWGDWVDNGERPSLLKLPAMLASILLHSALAGWAQVVGLFRYREQKVWVKTEHCINRTEDMAVHIRELESMEKLQAEASRAAMDAVKREGAAREKAAAMAASGEQ